MSRARSVADLGNQNVLSVSATNGNINVGTGVTLENTGEAQFSGIVTAPSIDTRNLIGDVSIGGVLTYEDVTNVDSIGVITARNGIVVGGGATVVGLSTFTKIAIGATDGLWNSYPALAPNLHVHSNVPETSNACGISFGPDPHSAGPRHAHLVWQANNQASFWVFGGSLQLAADQGVGLGNDVGIGTTSSPGSERLHVVGDSKFVGIVTSKSLDLDAIDKDITDSNVVDVFVYDTSKDSDGGAWRKRTQNTSWYNETLGTSTRGTRKEFPAVAVIVAETTKVTIYDGDDPDLPMWMVFNTTSGNLIGAGTLRGVTALNGIVVTAASGYTMETRFISDYSLDWFTNQLFEYKGNIEQRNDTLGFQSIESYGIVNAATNDVAMTVLPNAPVDSATGLPVPTIAVATDGGVSVIKDDGTVVQKAVTDSVTDVAKVEFTNDGFLLVNRNNYHYFVITPIDGAESTAHPSGFTGNINYFRNDGTNFPGPLSPDGLVSGYGNQSILKTIKGTDLAMADSYGLNIFNVTRGIPSTDNMVAYITSNYNTGWMHGNNKGAFLSDTTAESLTANTNLASSGVADGTNRLTSETYTSGATSWQMVDNAVSTNGYVVVGLKGLTVGQSYFISMTWDNNAPLDSGYEHRIAHLNGTAGENPTDFSHWNKTNGSSETLTGVFTAQSTDSDDLIMYCNAITLNVSNFNVRAVDDEDRSVNNKGLAVYGTITKQPVATGAELVSYSGWSASDNLVQPYNSDLNFGTGDFCFVAWIKKTSLSTNHYVLDRNDGSGETDRFSFMINSAGKLNLYSGSTNAQAESAAIFTGSSAWRMVLVKRVSGVITFGLDGKEYTSTTTVGNWSTTDLTGSGNENLFIGQYGGGGTPGNVVYNVDYGIGEIANVRLSASAPSPEQFKKMYEDEEHLYQENVKCKLHGSSDAVTALAYDEDTELLHVGTSAGRSEFQGLRQINNTTDAVAAAISASNDLVAEK